MANAGTDEIAVLAGSSNVYHNTLALFRDFHDICCYSKVQSIVSKSTRTGVEQCGVDFRYICNTTASIVERISSGWIANCIIFFEEPEAITKEDALSISDECAQLTEGFRKIHSYVVGMSERLHDKFEEVKNDNQLCLDEAEKAIEAADLENKLADNARKEAEMEARKAQSSQDGWFIAAWIPVVNIVALPMYLSSCDKTAEAMTAETGATEKSKIAAQIKHEAVKHQESAKDVADKIAELIKCVTKVEGIVQGQISFWKEQSDKFSSFAKEMANNSERLLRKKAQSNMKWLEERKTALDKYYTEMLEVSSGYNFSTSLKPSLPQLSLT